MIKFEENAVKSIEKYGENTVGPVVYSYVEWVICEALAKGISRLYFLARDAYLPYEIAKRITRARGIKMDLRYLYCSRRSLRMPSYHFIAEEAFELLFTGGYYITEESIVKRAGFTQEEEEELFKRLGKPPSDKPINKGELEEFRKRLLTCDFFRDKIAKKSKAAFSTAVDYFKEAGLFDGIDFGIVDSGWTGSMQRSLRMILNVAGAEVKITGFYFGTYARPKEENDGTYLSFYFTADSGALRKASFNNNVFECMLSANHAMTLGYEKNASGHTEPIFGEEHSEYQRALIEAQIRGVLRYTEAQILTRDAPQSYKKALKSVHKILRRALMKPSENFAKTYGSFSFCDDVSEAYKFNLANEEMKKSLGSYMLIPRILSRLFNIRRHGDRELFWPYGVIAFCHPLLRPWYRVNVWSWELLKAIRHR